MANSSGNWVLPVAVAVVLGLGGLWAVAQNKRASAQAAEDAARDAEAKANQPFADMPPEELPEHMREGAFSSGGGDAAAAGSSVSTAPAGLADDATWVKALGLAEEAETHYAAATAAHAAADRETLNEEGKRAQALFDQALESTAVWEEELLETYGENDSQVRSIKKRRSLWFDRTRWLHKSIAR
jgi:hypothetical protein